MAYKITKDLINNPPEEVGKGRFKMKQVEFTDEQMPFVFRLSDDDSIVYFEGISDDNSSERAFAPLDGIGQSYGCTMIEYQNNGKWEQL